MKMSPYYGPGFAVALSILAYCIFAQAADANTQSTRRLPAPTTLRGLAPQIVFKDNLMGSQIRNGLPPAKLDSFVHNAGQSAEHIYGDESTKHGPPPYMSFSETHRINSGITDDRDAGLTTGHGSYLPDAWGRDEFLGAPEFSQSARYDNQADGLPLKRDWVNKEDKLDGVSPRQFPRGFTQFEKVENYDEDRRRPPSDPYYQYLQPQRKFGSMNSH